MGIIDGTVAGFGDDSKISAEYMVTTNEEYKMNTTATASASDKVDKEYNSVEGQKAHSAPASNLGSGSSLIQGQETEIKRGDSIVVNPSVGNDEGKKSSGHLNNHPGKKKVKVDWTPELHRQFVQAVEQLGVDKAVPSKILELMGVDYLTRHNVASHLQKYRSHRKHLLAREAEVATWNRRRQIYGTTRRTMNRDENSWVVPSMAFPPVAPVNHSTPLHVWGHPSVPPLPVWTPAHPMPALLPGDTSLWHCCHQDVPAPGMPYFPHFPSTGFTTPPVYTCRVEPDVGVPFVPCGRTLPQPPSDSHPCKESIDAVIGDVLSKPWLPLPLGLKPPSIDSVMLELQRQGISKIPPQSVIK